jgi:ATP-dependent exoDNAse (exonuclease V) beta subunit
VIVDEAQDINVVMHRLLRRVHEGRTVLYVMDSSQKLYGFLSCVDVKSFLKGLGVPFTSWNLYLTYRHGSGVCEYVNSNSLSPNYTFPGSEVAPSTVEEMNSDKIVDGKHVVVVTTWENALRIAQEFITTGRRVGIDSSKAQDLKDASSSETYSKYSGGLFKRMGRSTVHQIVAGLVDDYDVFITTVHGYKGLEADVVRVMPDVFEREGDDARCLVYVAVTRARRRLIIPSGFRIHKIKS